VDTVVLARHAESTFALTGTCNGEPSACGGLTDRGREQARALGVLLADDPLELVAVSEFRRAQETADIALAGRHIVRLVLPELNDIRFGRFEGAPLADYRVWAHAAGPGEACPGGGESRAEAASRFAAGYRRLLERSESVVLVVAHALPIRYVLGALIERDPAAVVEPVPYAEPNRITAAQLERAVDRLERWSRAPAWGGESRLSATRTSGGGRGEPGGSPGPTTGARRR
jgi:broad specificity phosphatase PhoE